MFHYYRWGRWCFTTAGHHEGQIHVLATAIPVHPLPRLADCYAPLDESPRTTYKMKFNCYQVSYGQVKMAFACPTSPFPASPFPIPIPPSPFQRPHSPIPIPFQVLMAISTIPKEYSGGEVTHVTEIGSNAKELWFWYRPDKLPLQPRFRSRDLP